MPSLMLWGFAIRFSGQGVKMTARFWMYVNGSFVKLSLKPGDCLSWSTGGYTDEGYSSAGDTYSYDGRRVLLETWTDGRDCDGRSSTQSLLTCKVWNLGARPLDRTWRDSDPEVARAGLPLWALLNSGGRDYSAEAMGY